MSAPKPLTPFLMAAVLIAGGLACSKPETVTKAPDKPSAQAQDQAQAEANAKKQAEAEQKRKAEAEEAARKAAAAAEAQKAEAARLEAVEARAALKDIHFEYDQANLMSGDKPVLQAVADFMKAHADAVITVEGHCDERGTVEYNLALGERRAQAALAYLVSLGVPEGRLSKISYGKEKPLCTEGKESCWSLNRRDHFVLK